MRKRRNYEEGTWFLVPIDGIKFIPGVVARVSATSRGILLGYFFADIFVEKPEFGALCDLNASGARAIIRFGDMGLLNEEWPVLGKCANWLSVGWPTPNFVRVEPLTRRHYEVFYDDSDPAKRLGERAIEEEKAAGLEPDRLSGHGAVQRYMAHILGYKVPPLDINKLKGQ